MHTNLGRSVLSDAAAAAVAEVATGYSTLEYDVESGERGSRHVHVESLLCRLTGAEAAMAVNNNAGAVMLAIAGLARGREAIVSRADSSSRSAAPSAFPTSWPSRARRWSRSARPTRRISQTTRRALTSNTGLLLKVHSSNFRVVGFTEEVSLAELVHLGASHGGVRSWKTRARACFFDLRRYGLPHEPTVAESIAAGAAVVTASGDKLLGGPQAGILVGRWDVISKLKAHPMARALRLDKLTLAALEATLRACLDEQRALAEIPTLRMLTEPAVRSARARRGARVAHSRGRRRRGRGRDCRRDRARRRRSAAARRHPERRRRDRAAHHVGRRARSRAALRRSRRSSRASRTTVC